MDCDKDLFLVDEIVMILKRNGIKIGHNELFRYWRKNGYLIANGENKNMPTPRAVELGLFEVKENTTVKQNNDICIHKWIMVTKKGLFYFLGHFSIDEIKREINV